jgi:hypothetical protein
MRAQRELTELAASKAALRLRIAVRRDRTAAAAAVVTAPLACLDRLVLRWQELSPLLGLARMALNFLPERPRRDKRRG